MGCAEKFALSLDWKGAVEMTDDTDNPFARRLSGLDLTIPFNISGKRFRETFKFSDIVAKPTALARAVENEK
ncbi:MAG: hypothetical protein ACJAYE_002163 [Candidatus Azotimanducaceae bacterium]